MRRALRRVLIVGLGSIGRRHARLVRELLPDAATCALRRAASGGEAPAAVDRTVATLSDALRFGPDAAIISNPSTMHLQTALPLAAAGVHLLVEKPLSHTVDGVAELITRCEAAELTLMVGYNLRYARSLVLFRELVQAGRIGHVRSVRAEVGQVLTAWRMGADYRETVSARAALGGGVLLELSHELDYLRWIFGDVKAVSATLQRQGNLEIDVEDTAHLVLTFAAHDTVPALVASLNMDFIRHDTTRYCVAIGDKGSLRWDGVRGTVAELAHPGSGWQELHKDGGDRDDTYREQWRDFVQCVLTGEQPGVTGRDGLAVLEIVQAARESAVSGCKTAVGMSDRAAQSR